MTVELSKELLDALNATGDRELEVVDPRTNRRYTIVDSEIHRRAMEALRRQQEYDQQEYEAIAEGVAQMEAGEGEPLDKAFARMRSRLGFPQAP